MTNREQIRRMIAQEAARLMYEEGVKEYLDAKRKAARRFGPGSRLALGSCLPSNAEIHAELGRLLRLHEKKLLPARLFRLRMLALRVMERLASFDPLLVGSVLAGTATERSDIDLHLFADNPEEVERHLRELGIPFESRVVSIRKKEDFIDYHHLYLEEEGVVVECTIYPVGERRRAPRSSITGRPMERAGIVRLKKLLGEGLPG